MPTNATPTQSSGGVGSSSGRIRTEGPPSTTETIMFSGTGSAARRARLALILACVPTTPAALSSPRPDRTRIAPGLPRHHVRSAHARQAHPRQCRRRSLGRPRCLPAGRRDRAPGRRHLHRQLHPAQETRGRLDPHPFVGARPSPPPWQTRHSVACEPDAQDRHAQPGARPPDRRRRPPLPVRRDRGYGKGRHQEHGALLGQQRRLPGVRRRADFIESGAPPTSSSTAATSMAPPPEASGAASP
jgi:hypothetical protein